MAAGTLPTGCSMREVENHCFRLKRWRLKRIERSAKSIPDVWAWKTHSLPCSPFFSPPPQFLFSVALVCLPWTCSINKAASGPVACFLCTEIIGFSHQAKLVKIFCNKRLKFISFSPISSHQSWCPLKYWQFYLNYCYYFSYSHEWGHGQSVAQYFIKFTFWESYSTWSGRGQFLNSVSKEVSPTPAWDPWSGRTFWTWLQFWSSSESLGAEGCN